MGDVVGRGVERSLRCVSQIEPAVMTDSPPLLTLDRSGSGRVPKVQEVELGTKAGGGNPIPPLSALETGYGVDSHR